MAAARYVELNPVSAGIVREAVDDPWSSARFHLGVSQGDALVRDKSLLGLVADWGEYLKSSDEPEVRQRCSEEFGRVGQRVASNS